MKATLHLFNTWLLALLIFPLLFTTYNVLVHSDANVDLLLPLLLFGAVCSLPALLLCRLSLILLRRVLVGAPVKICIWGTLVLLLILLTGLIFGYLFFDSFVQPELLQATGSALAAALLSIVLRLPQFFALVTTQTHTYERNLV